MSTILLPFIVALHLFLPKKTENPDCLLPKTWTKDFVITYKYSGSMDGSSTLLTFTFDSIQYVYNKGMKPGKTKVLVMTDKDRKTILSKMHELKVDEGTSEIKIAPVNDGYSMLLCFGCHCIEGGTSAEMSERSKEIFSAAKEYLEEYAANKKR